MNVICTINQNTLYERCEKEKIPFFKWHAWIEQTLNKEFMDMIF